MHLVISSNQKPHSHTRILAGCAFDELSRLNEPVDLVDLRDYSLSMNGEDELAEQGDITALTNTISAADSILLATPIYHFDVAAVTKTLIEATGEAWRHKVVGFLCTAAGRRSYMSIMGLANSLMLEYRCLIVPYFVFTKPKSFDGNELQDERAIHQIAELAVATCHMNVVGTTLRESRQIRRSH